MLVAQFQNILNWNELWEDFFLSIFYFKFSIFYYNSCFHKPSDISEKIRTKNCAARSATVWSEFSNILLDKIQVCIHSSTLASFFSTTALKSSSFRFSSRSLLTTVPSFGGFLDFLLGFVTAFPIFCGKGSFTLPEPTFGLV